MMSYKISKAETAHSNIRIPINVNVWSSSIQLIIHSNSVDETIQTGAKQRYNGTKISEEIEVNQ